MLKLLLLEDDYTLSAAIKSYLIAKGLVCDTVYDGELFLKQLKSQVYDFYLLDINVPKINGMDICERVRAVNKTTPIIMLTAYGEISDKVEAFEKGADDYLVKPFHLEELHMRILALNRRKETPQMLSSVLEVGDLMIYEDEKKVERGGVDILLTPKEFKLLCILAHAKGRVLSKEQIASKLWDYHIETSVNTIEVYINFLRNKIDKHSDDKLIHTKPGYGYYLKGA